MRIKSNALATCHAINVALWAVLMSARMPQEIVRSKSAKSMNNCGKGSGTNLEKHFPRHQSNPSANWNASSYLDQLLAENRRLKEQSVTSADAAEVNGPPNTER